MSNLMERYCETEWFMSISILAGPFALVSAHQRSVSGCTSFSKSSANIKLWFHVGKSTKSQVVVHWNEQCRILKGHIFKAVFLLLLSGISQYRLVEVDLSLCTLHSLPQTVTLEKSGSNPVPWTVNMLPPPWPPRWQKKQDSFTVTDQVFLIDSTMQQSNSRKLFTFEVYVIPATVFSSLQGNRYCKYDITCMRFNVIHQELIAEIDQRWSIAFDFVVEHYAKTSSSMCSYSALDGGFTDSSHTASCTTYINFNQLVICAKSWPCNSYSCPTVTYYE